MGLGNKSDSEQLGKLYFLPPQGAIKTLPQPEKTLVISRGGLSDTVL